MAKAPYVASVVNPLTSQGASALSKDKATGYLSVTHSVSPGRCRSSDAQTIIDAAAKPAKAAGLEVQTGGQLGQKVSKPVDRVQRADRDHRRDGDPHVHVRDGRGDAAADRQRDLRAGLRRWRSSGMLEPRADGVDGRADAGDDDRPRASGSTTRCSSSRGTSAGCKRRPRHATSRSRARPRPRAARCSSPAAR